MARTRVSTTVDAQLLADARHLRAGLADARLLEEALAALLARFGAAEVDAAYSAYDEHPLDEPDEWAISPRFAPPPERLDSAAGPRRAVVV